MPTASLVLIVAPMAEEAAAVIDRLAAPVSETVGGRRVVRGRLTGRPVAVCPTGDGPRNAERGLAALLPALAPTELRIVGIAGGLSPGLQAGDVIAGHHLREGVEGPVLREERVVPGGVLAGTVLTADHIVSKAEEKKSLWKAMGSPEPAVVDLESTVYVRGAMAAGIPWRVLRVVTDPAEVDLPLELESFRNAEGAVDRLRVARYAALRPHLLRKLMELRSVVKGCSTRLADALEADLAIEGAIP